ISTSFSFNRLSPSKFFTLSLHDALPISCVSEISKRLAKPEEFTTREIWGTRQPQSMYDANDGDLKHINFFFFNAQDDFKQKFETDRKSTRLNSSHVEISYAVFCLKKKKK